MIDSNPDKSLADYLEILIKKLRQIQRGLPYRYRDSDSLRDHLLSACGSIPACKTVILRPSATFKSLASELRNAVGAEMRCQVRSRQVKTVAAEHQYFVDRKYDRRVQRPARNYGNNAGFDKDKAKRCFVYKKEGCWSTKHSAQDRKATYDKWRQETRRQGQHATNAYLATVVADFEGIEADE